MIEDDAPKKKIFRKPAVSRKYCEQMRDKYNLNLIDVEVTQDQTFKVNCVFYNEEFNFQELWYDN
ncbi:MAG: hypothetical protein F6K47_23465 [Symploca sp. SIO2E6]|nr:hypothetical protein [Symploca sp. SIO2E6]